MQQTTEQSAPGRSTREAQDADEHAHNLTNWQQEYDQLSGGRFYGRIDEVALDGCQLFKEHTNRALRQQCNVWKDALWIGIPARASDCRINGLSVGKDQLMCRPGDRDFELMTPDAFDIYGIVIREETLLRAAEREGRVLDLQSLEHSPRLTVPQAQLDQVRILLEQVLYRDALGLDSEHASQALLQLVTNAAQPAAAPSYAHRRKVVEQVKCYLAEHPDAPLSIPELCERVHVSRRTLQYSFENMLGISPLQFLRSARLNQVRRALCEPQQTSPIASIAAERGFWHPGQFARDYKALFGENPSETVKRSR